MDTSTFAIVRLNKGANRLQISLPNIGTQHLKFQRALKEYVVQIGELYYEVNTNHRDWAIEQLRFLYEGVVEYREYASEGRCDTRCQNANIRKTEDDPDYEKWEEYRRRPCVCKCMGEFHGGGGDWKYVIGTTLIGLIQQTTRYYPSLDLHLMASPLPLWVEELKGPHPVYALIRDNMLPAIPSEQEETK